MRKLQMALAMILLCTSALAAQPDIPTGAPDRAEVRATVDGLLKRFTDEKSKATLGMLQQAIGLSISYGAPAWNDGDHEACCNFYVQTADSICKAFPDEGSATPLAWAVISDFKAALNKTKGSTDMDANAWTFRYVFDKANISFGAEVTRSLAMMKLGLDCLKRGQYSDAADAFGIASETTHEMYGLTNDRAVEMCLLAPMALADAQFISHKYNDAARTLEFAVVAYPKLTEISRDLPRVFGNPQVFDQTLDDLAAQAEKSPNDAELQLLLGYEYFFSGHRSSAKLQFEKTLELKKEDGVAKAFLDRIRAIEPPQPGDPVRRSL